MELSGLLQRFYEMVLNIISDGNKDRFAHYTYEVRFNDNDKYYHYIIPSDKYGQYSYNKALLNKYAISSVFVYGLPFITIGHNFDEINVEPIYDAKSDTIKALDRIVDIIMGMKEFQYEIYKPSDDMQAIDVGYLSYEYNHKVYDATIAENKEANKKELSEIIKHNKDVMAKRLNYILNLDHILRGEFSKLVTTP